jgi:hypothetical protein
LGYHKENLIVEVSGGIDAEAAIGVGVEVAGVSVAIGVDVRVCCESVFVSVTCIIWFDSSAAIATGTAIATRRATAAVNNNFFLNFLSPRVYCPAICLGLAFGLLAFSQGLYQHLDLME